MTTSIAPAAAPTSIDQAYDATYLEYTDAQCDGGPAAVLATLEARLGHLSATIRGVTGGYCAPRTLTCYDGGERRREPVVYVVD
jgi:hypothetical protein